MWTKDYEPTPREWYLIKINGVKFPAVWSVNKFFVDMSGKTYKLNEIDCWLDDSKL